MNAFADEETPVGRGRSRRARGVRWLIGGVVAAFVAGALPAVSGAADYCVAPNTSCDGPHNVATLQEALKLAYTATDSDRVILGAATYTAPSVNGFDYLNSNAPVEIVGQGVAQTTLTSPEGSSEWVLRLRAGAGSSIHDLAIRLPKNVADGFSGLHTNSVARRIQVTEDPTQAGTTLYGVDLVTGGTLEDSSVSLDDQQLTAAVFLVTPDVAVRGSALSARIGAKSWGGTIERSRVTASESGVQANYGVTAIASSLIRVTQVGGGGITALTSAGAHSTVNADGLTIIGSALPDTSGAFVGNEPDDTQSVAINLTNSVIRGVSAPLYAESSGTGLGHVAASYSDYDPSGNVTKGTAGITESNVSNVGDAGFVDAAGGDYHLLPGSPLIDAGDPASAQGFDLDGNPLVTDGNGDASARRDLGAFELRPAAPGAGQPPAGDATAAADTQAPRVSSFNAAPSLFVVARTSTPLAARLPRGTRFRYTLSEDARVTIAIQRCVRPTPRLQHARRCTRYRTIGALERTATHGASSIRFTGRFGSRTLHPGRYRARISATDTAGNRSTPRTARFRVAAADRRM